MKHLLVTFAVASGLLAASALLQPAFADVPAEPGDSTIGQVLVEPQGSTLYVFDKDADGQSACVDQCAEKWPPHMAMDSDQPDGDYTIIDRADGSKQWAYKGKPLYRWSGDTAPGETKGDGLNGVWHAARP